MDRLERKVKPRGALNGVKRLGFRRAHPTGEVVDAPGDVDEGSRFAGGAEDPDVVVPIDPAVLRERPQHDELVDGADQVRRDGGGEGGEGDGRGGSIRLPGAEEHRPGAGEPHRGVEVGEARPLEGEALLDDQHRLLERELGALDGVRIVGGLEPELYPERAEGGRGEGAAAAKLGELRVGETESREEGCGGGGADGVSGVSGAYGGVVPEGWGAIDPTREVSETQPVRSGLAESRPAGGELHRRAGSWRLKRCRRARRRGGKEKRRTTEARPTPSEAAAPSGRPGSSKGPCGARKGGEGGGGAR